MRNRFLNKIKVIGAVAVLTCISYAGFAQMSFGPKLGYTYGNFAQHGDPLYDGKSGFAFGGFFDMSFEDFGFDFLSATAELYYMRQGANQVNPNLVYSTYVLNNFETSNIFITRTDVSLRTFELPLTINVTAPGFSGDVKPTFCLGYSIGLLAKAYARTDYTYPGNYSGGTYSVTVEGKDDVTSAFKRWNNSFVLGGGIQIDGDYPMFIGVKYLMGMNKIGDNEFASYTLGDGGIGRTDIFKNTLLFSVGVSFAQ